MLDAETAIRHNVLAILGRKGGDKDSLTPDSDFYSDLEFDSLEVAELSVALEEEFGSDPYSQGLVPRTITEVLAFYSS